MSTTSEMALLEVRRFLSEEKISETAKILIAFSGGADSLALLLLLSKLFPCEQLCALYVNHRLRDEFELQQEEELNQSNADTIGVVLSIVRLAEGEVANLATNRGNGLEEAARVLRYAALEQKRVELSYDYIATAHTADDQSETILMRMFQGSGPNALQGIAQRKGRIIRPLLRLTRNQIEEIVSESDLLWAEDSTNSDTQYLRNQIRHALIPVVDRLFPRYREALQQVADRNQLVVQAFTDEVDKAIEDIMVQEQDAIILNLSLLKNKQSLVVQRLLYHAWNLVTKKDGRRLPYRNIQSIQAKIASRWAEGEQVMISGTLLTRKNDTLVWRLEPPSLAEGYISCVYSSCTELDGNRQLIIGEEVNGSYPVGKRLRIDESLLCPPIIVRSFTTGDTIRLVEGTKKIASLFADWHITPSQRWRIPVLEDTQGIFAVLGGAYGGKDRVATRCLCTPLAPNRTTLYSVTDIEG